MNRQNKKTKKGPNPINMVFLILALIGLSIVGYQFVYKSFLAKKVPNKSDNVEVVQPQVDKQKTGKLRVFSPEEFRNLYNNFAYPNTQYITQNSYITGNEEADLYIQNLAEQKGYKRRSAPVTDTFVTVQKDILLQQRASEDWQKLSQAAKAENVNLTLNAGYRSSKEQQEIFAERLGLENINTSYIATGTYDNKITELLKTTAIPGYSRHHTGFTVDIGCLNDPITAFEYTVCYNWLEKDNYKNAKTYGWIPSYPEGASDQGPEPESWEYVWVGTDATYE